MSDEYNFVDEEDEGDEEIVVVDDEEFDPDSGLPDDVKGKSKKELWEEYQEKQGQADTIKAMQDSFKAISDKLGDVEGRKSAVQQQQPQVQQQPGESDEEFDKRVAKELFASDNPAQLLRELNERSTRKTLGPILGVLHNQAKSLIELDPNDGPMYKKYKDEVDQMVESMPQQQRANPQVYKMALERTKAMHQEDIINERASQIAEELVNKKLKEAGISVGEGGGESGEVRSKPAAKGPTSGVGSSGKKGKRISASKMDEYKREAEISGIPLDVYLKYYA